MSLINEALKKAQKQQLDAAAKDTGPAAPTGNPPPPPKAPPAAPAPEPESDPIFSARRQRSRGGKGKWMIMAVAILVIGGVGVFLSSKDSAEPAGAVQTVAVNSEPQDPNPASVEGPMSKASAPTLADKPVEQEATAEPAEQPAPIVSLPPSLVVTPVPEPNLEEKAPTLAAMIPPKPEPRVSEVAEPSPAPIAAEPVVRAEPAPVQSGAKTQPTPVVIAPKSTPAEAEPVRSVQTAPAISRPESKVVIETLNEPSASNITDSTEQGAPASGAVLNYLEKARVTGIRVSATDPKVLMNNRVYRLNEIVDRDLQLRIVHIAPRELRFQDSEGHVYRKTF